MALARRVEPERLDVLPAHDPDAIHSRGDLRRLNVVMRQAEVIADVLGRYGIVPRMQRVVDLGGGDGTLLLRLTRRLAPLHPGLRATIVDRHAAVDDRTRAALAGLGCPVEVAESDVFDWLTRTPPEPGTLTLANLFLHHFTGSALGTLLDRIARRSTWLVACEPRRSRWTLTASRLVGLLGCNAVTRADAVTSVRAGFIGRELSAAWPTGGDWSLDERPAGPFSHLFVARRAEDAAREGSVPDAPRP